MPTALEEPIESEREAAASREYGAWIEITIIALLTLVAAIRLYKLGYWSFWVDEMFTLRSCLSPGHVFPDKAYPLSYLLIGAAVERMGVSEWNARIVPALVGVITPAAVYLLARREFGKGPAVGAALIIALSPWHLYWSQMARFYTLTMLFSAMAALLFFSGMERNRPWRTGAAAICMILGILSHYSAFLMLAALILYAVARYLLKWEYRVTSGSRKASLAAFFAPFLVAGVVLAPKVVSILHSYRKPAATTGTEFASPLKGAIYVASSALYRVEFAVAAAAVLAALFLLRKKDRRGLFLTAVAVVPILLMMIAGALSRGENRYALVTLPAFALLAGIAVTAAWDALRPKSAALAVMVPLVLAMPLLQHTLSYFGPVFKGERWDYRAAAEIVRAGSRSGDMVLTPMSMPIRYYLTGQITGMEVGKRPDIEVANLKANQVSLLSDYRKRIWFVVEDSTRGESAGVAARAWLTQHADLRANFPACSPMANYGLSVYLYTPPGRR